MDILDELSLTNKRFSTLEIEQAFTVPGEGRLQNLSGDFRSTHEQVYFQQSKEIPIDIKQIKVKLASNPLVHVTHEKEFDESFQENIFAKSRSTLDYPKIYKDFGYFFNLYPLVSLSNFKASEKLFVSYFANRREILVRISEFKKVIDTFSSERDKFGKLIFDFKLKAHSLQITMQRSRLKGVKQYLSISLNSDAEFICFTQWNWKHKKEELIRSRDPFKVKKITKDSLAFDAKVWQAFNNQGLKRKHFMKSLDCLDRNQDRVIDFINLANKKSIINLIEPDLFSNVSIKTDNQNTLFLNFRSNIGQKVDVRLTHFASSIVVLS